LEILLVALAGTIAGADDFVETALWGAKQIAVPSPLATHNGIPSHDTLCVIPRCRN
jgi:hypothetical protein